MQGTLFSVAACLSSVLMRQVYPHIHLWCAGELTVTLVYNSIMASDSESFPLLSSYS
jgi:hypothetical protein